MFHVFAPKKLLHSITLLWSVALNCDVWPPFLRRGVVLVSRPGTYEMSMPDDDQHTLKLLRVRGTDVGQLVVTASNQFGSDLCTLQLTMAGRFGSGGAAHDKYNLLLHSWQRETPMKGRLFVI